ncbi:hypothetical protein [Halanaerobium congolense]|jgi:hypothetical protein|uniref:Uncharacterized protein n=1 Tax=Halanaerobium congolense TaxID=54121 RepID=A0A4R7DTT5_9FIRM|nr:hypothetical protein [Halanaerobium congolense]TDS25390.1 hypothetical protein BY453_1592 [Halanaerobium congolense]
MKLPDIEYFLLRIGLYEELSFDIDSYDWINDLKNKRLNIDAYCPECGEISTFNSSTNSSRAGSDFSDQFNPNMNLEESTLEKIVHKKYNDFIDNNKIIERKFKCARNETHIMFFYFMIKDERHVEEENKILKIGQYPSMVDLNKIELKKYKKQLAKILTEELASEYNKAVMLHTHGYGVASFVHLRRIFEGLIEKTFLEKIDDIGLDKETFYKKRMDKKIDLLKEYIPDFLGENSYIYSILSKGIHELDEKECLEIFDILKTGIEIILEEKIEKINKEKRKKFIEKELNKVNSNLS